MEPPSPALLLTLLLLLLLAKDSLSSDRILSRSKRYLVFPPGSSLQLVFELAVPTLHPRPYTMAWTLSTAWELPTNAKEILEKYKFRNEAPPPPPPPPTQPPHDHFFDYHDAVFMKGPPKNGEHGNNMGRKEFYLPPFKNQKFISDGFKNHDGYYKGFYKGYRGYSHPAEVYLHRRHRREAFLKLEHVLLAADMGGRPCILRSLCEAAKHPAGPEKQSFLYEILHALFTLPPSAEDEDQRGQQNDVLAHYDTARDAGASPLACAELYPSCSKSLFQLAETAGI